MLRLITRVLGTRNDRELKAMHPLVDRINEFEGSLSALSDQELQGKTAEFRQRLAAGGTLEEILCEAFAVVREASRRTMGMRHFDCQLLGGIVLHRGAIAEMKTGEGKTLTATLPVYLNALEGKGVHVVTVNDYLAKRDAEWMGILYRWLGLSVGVIYHDLSDAERRLAYHSDITYGTNNEMGFDYLRDNMKFTPTTKVQRSFHYAIVDEVDSVLIDEARTPLIIAGPTEDNVDKYYQANALLERLHPEHYTVDEKDRLALFTEEGMAWMEKQLHLQNLYDPDNIEILHCLEQGLKAHQLFKRDVDYMVQDGQVVIIDEHTGRPMKGRRYSDGMHQALEAKEGVKIERQTQTLASVTFQNFFRMYGKLSGMTGTAETEATEFLNIYKLKVYVVPPNRRMIRRDENDQIYRSKKEKFDAILQEIERLHGQGQPVLVGTIAVETSEYLSQLLLKRGIKHVVLNAKFHAQESEIIAQAGRHGAVTIATNMAGRGTDIILGGNAEMLARTAHHADPESDYDALLRKFKALCDKEKEQVLALGGLAIIGTERHDSRRIDNQLRGRSGRQGDPGYSRFYLCLEDNLMRLFGSERTRRFVTSQMEEGEPIEHRWISKSIERAQKNVENRHFEYRKHLLEYDDVMNRQRNTFYAMREQILHSDPRAFLFHRMEEISRYQVETLLLSRDGADASAFKEAVRHQFGLEPPPEWTQRPRSETSDLLLQSVKSKYQEKWDALGIQSEQIVDHERFLILYVIDQQWKDHMRNMDALKEGISLQGYAQKDPLIEYKKQSFSMFNDLMDRMDEEVVRTLMHLQPRVGSENMERMKRHRVREQAAMRQVGGEQDAGSKTVRRAAPKLGRNEPCHCGSGLKFKNCHGKQV
jgi:preprotein translocase subunit SecA